MRLYSVCILVCFVLPHSYGQALILGQIFDSNNSKIVLQQPIDGFCNRIIELPGSEVQLDHDHHFKRYMNLASPSVIILNIGLRPIWLVAMPDDTIIVYVNVDQFSSKSTNGGLTIEGRNGPGIKVFNDFNFQPGKKFGDFDYLLDSLNFRQTLNLQSIEYALSRVLAPFDSLLKCGSITKQFYDLVTGDTKGVLLTEITKNELHKRGDRLKAALDFLDKMYSRYPLTNEMMKAGLNAKVIAYYYYRTKTQELYYPRQYKDSTIRIGSEELFINRDIVPWLFAPEPMKEVYWAMDLISLKALFSDVYGEGDIKSFITLNPKSVMSEYLKPPYFGVVEHPNQVDKSNFVFMGFDNSSSFAELLSRFHGQKLLVDLWATWCTPCKFEFSYNGQADSVCRQLGVARLYISFDKESTADKVQPTAYAYNLQGYHITATGRLLKDIIAKVYKGDNSYPIPRYLLINQEGVIVNPDAPRPSSGNMLYKAMKLSFARVP